MDLKMTNVCPSMHAIWSDFSQVPDLIFFKLGTVMTYHGGFMHAK